MVEMNKQFQNKVIFIFFILILSILNISAFKVVNDIKFLLYIFIGKVSFMF